MPRSLRLVLTATAHVATIAAACGSQAGPAPAPSSVPTTATATATSTTTVDPTGRWELTLDRGTERRVMIATMHLRTDGTIAGAVTSETAPMLTIRTGTVRGQTLSMRVAAEDGTEARLELVVDGDRVAGRWTKDSGDFLRVTGRRLR